MWLKEKDRQLKEQFINGKNDDDMMSEIIRELTTIKRLMQFWYRRVEVQRARREILDATKESKECNAVKRLNRTIPQTTQNKLDSYPPG